jgi:hypothetical protein
MEKTYSEKTAGGDPLPADPIESLTGLPRASISQEIAATKAESAGKAVNVQPPDLNLKYAPTRPRDEQFYNLLLDTGIAPLRAKAQVHHRRILPELRQDHPREWAAYHGERLLEIGGSRAALYQACVSRGFDVSDVLVLGIAPEGPAEIDFARLHLSVNGDERFVSMLARERV